MLKENKHELVYIRFIKRKIISAGKRKYFQTRQQEELNYCMRKIIAAINMTLDGYFDHTAIDPDEEVHQHYTDILDSGDAILYGRKTFQLMEFWKSFIKKPSGEKSMDNFAIAIDRIPKIVFSNTIKETGWQSASLATRNFEEEARALKSQAGRDIFIGSRSLIIQALELNLLDELQLCIHPVITGNGMQLFEKVKERHELKLAGSKKFSGGAIILYYNQKNMNETIVA